MAQKKIWLSWMPSGEDAPEAGDAVAKLGRYGLHVAGGPWGNPLDRLAWAKVAEVLLDSSRSDAWILAGHRAELDALDNRRALSLLTTMVSSARGPRFPLLVLCLDAPLHADDLPLLARRCGALSATDPSWPAKVVAATTRTTEPVDLGFLFNVHAHPLIGQFYELGPIDLPWEGVMVGLHGAACISHHAVGPRGEIPEGAVVEYELRDLKADVGGREFTAWAVKNHLTPSDSYYLRVDGTPDAILVSGYPGDESELEASVIDLA